MKKVISFTVDEELCQEFEKVCSNNFMNRSALIESLIDQFLTAHKSSHNLSKSNNNNNN